MFDDLIDDIVYRFGDSLVIIDNGEYKLSFFGSLVFVSLALGVYDGLKKNY